MALHHAEPGEIVDIRPLGARIHETVNATLIRSKHLQVFRLLLPAGKVFKEHAVPGEITVQCLEGEVEITSPGRTQVLAAGELLYLVEGDLHGLKGLADASVLVTVLLPEKA